MPIPTLSSAEVPTMPVLEKSSPTPSTEQPVRIRSGGNVSKKYALAAVANYHVTDEDKRIFVANSFLQIRGPVLAGL